MTSLSITELGVYKLLLFYFLFTESASNATQPSQRVHSSSDAFDILSTIEWMVIQINHLDADGSSSFAFSYDSFMTLFTDESAFVESLYDPSKPFFRALTKLNSKHLETQLSSGIKSNCSSGGHSQGNDRRDSVHSRDESYLGGIMELPNTVRKVFFEFGNGSLRVLRTLAREAVHDYMNVRNSTLFTMQNMYTDNETFFNVLLDFWDNMRFLPQREDGKCASGSRYCDRIDGRLDEEIESIV